MDDAPVLVLDANVLYSAPLRDLLMHLSLERLLQPRWTRAINDEWVRNVLANNPAASREKLERTCSRMEAAFPEGLVAGYEPLIVGLTLPDPDDHHVLAAAIHARASVVITLNLVDFPAAALTPHGIQAVHPDAFVADLLQHRPSKVLAAVRTQRAGLTNPPKSPDEFLATLARQPLPRTVAMLRERIDEL